jgi:putative component of membrane protein insertase Oxa1/YidC/SpoIIIJ protein YidD
MESKHIKRATLGAVAALGMAWSLTSSALTISDTIQTLNTFSDNDAEILINVDNSTDANGFPTVTTGDILISALGFNQYNATQGTAVTNEATVLNILQVGSVTPTASTNCGGAPSCATYTFTAVADFNAVASSFGLGTFTDANGNPLAAGTVGVVFFDNSKDFFNSVCPDFCTSIPQIYQFATDGTVVATLGLGSFTGSAPSDLVDLTSADASIAPGAGAGGFAFNLTFLTQAFPGFTVSSNLTGTTNISEPFQGPLLNGGIRTDSTANFTAVPEPATSNLP